MNATTKSPLVPVLKRRIRALTWLAGVTALLVVFAIIAQWQRASLGQSEFTAVRMFPGLEAQAERIASIHIEARGVSFSVVRSDAGKWSVPEKGNYGADFNEIRRAVLGQHTRTAVHRSAQRNVVILDR